MKTEPEKKSGHYIHKITYNHRERVVGLFVFSAFILITALIIISGRSQHLFEKHINIYINVASSEGISQGSIVQALGTEVGKISDLSLTQGRKIRVTIEVYEGQREFLRADAKATVNRLANINTALIEIDPGSIELPILADGATIPVEETPSLNDLLLGIAHIIQSADKHDLLSKFEVLLPKLELTIENAHKIIDQIATGHGVLGAAVFDTKVETELKTVVTSGAGILQEAEGIASLAKQRLIQIEPVLNNVQYISQDLRGTTQNLPALVLELNEIIKQANTALTLINGELENIPGTVIDARRTLSKTDRLVDSAQNTWPLSSDIEQNKPNQLIQVQPLP